MENVIFSILEPHELALHNTYILSILHNINIAIITEDDIIGLQESWYMDYLNQTISSEGNKEHSIYQLVPNVYFAMKHLILHLLYINIYHGEIDKPHMQMIKKTN